MSITREELMKRFPKATEAFLAMNADIEVSHSAIGSSGPRQSSTPRAEVALPLVSIPPASPRSLELAFHTEFAAPAVLQIVPPQVGQEIKLTLPYPPSANNYWRSIISQGRVLVLVSTEAKHYKRAVGIIAGAKIKTPLPGALIVTSHVYRPRKVGDLSNTIKVLEDALEGICYRNDSQIVQHHWYRHDDKANPRVELSITCAPCVEDGSLLL